jgi:branched-chain amino acid transport system permease protein
MTRSPTDALARSARVRPFEIGIWVVAVAAGLLFSRYAPLWNEIAILALFAVSLDLILGYAGIVSLGHAAFFGAGAYAAGLFAKHVMGDPLVGLAVGAAVGAGPRPGHEPARAARQRSHALMVTLGEALILYELANRLDNITGGADGLQGVVLAPLLGRFPFGLSGQTAYVYSLTVLFILFLVGRRLVHSPFGYSLEAIRDNRMRATAIGIPVNARLAAIYTIAAAYAGVAGALLAQTTGFASLDVLDFHRSADVMLMVIIGGTGYLYGGLIGAVVFRAPLRHPVALDHDVLAVLAGADPDRAGAGGPRAPRAAVPRARGRAAPARAACNRRATPMTAGPALRTQHLDKSFGGIHATQDVSLSVESGARHALIGPNGAGKTTLVNLLTGVLEPSAGTIELHGEDITRLPAHQRVRRGLVRTFQINQLFADMSPLETLTLVIAQRDGVGAHPWRPLGRHKAQVEEAAALAQRFHLSVTMHRKTRVLAYGKRRLPRDRDRRRRTPARAAARRARGRRARGRIARDPRHAGRAARRRDGAAHRARHGPRVPLRDAHVGPGQRRALRGRLHRRHRARSARQGGLSRRGEPCLTSCASRACAPATPRRSSSTASGSRSAKASRWRSSAATAPARPRCCARSSA